MSLVPVTVDIERDIEIDDAYGGVTVVPQTLYVGLIAWVNFANRRPNERSESTQQHGAAGPGVVTRTRAFAKFEPRPNIDTKVNDRLVVHGGDSWLVVGIRPYEYTLQLDLDLVQ